MVRKLTLFILLLIAIAILSAQQYSSGPGSGGSIAAATEYLSQGYSGTGIAVGTANHIICGGFVVPPGGLSVGHVVLNVGTADGTNNSDFGIYNSGGTLEAHIGAGLINPVSSTTSYAFTGGTQTIAAGKAYACYTSIGTTLNLQAVQNTSSFYHLQDTTQTSSSGALPSTITALTDSLNTANVGAPMMILYP